MTTQPHEQPEDPIDADLAALLAEDAADARQAPDQLQAKVLALTDPKLLSLLDEALAPEAVPSQLNAKILAATTPKQLAAASREEAPAVIGRIGLSTTTWRYAAAAAILLTAGVGLWWNGQQVDNSNEVAKNSETPINIATLIEVAQAEPLFDSATDDVQKAIQSASNRIDAYAIDRESIWSDMDDYEQFLSELEDAEDMTPST